MFNDDSEYELDELAKLTKDIKLVNAIKYYDELLENKELKNLTTVDDAHTLLSKGHVLLQLGEFDEAKEAFDHIIQLVIAHPYKADTLLSKGHALYQLEKYDDLSYVAFRTVGVNPDASFAKFPCKGLNIFLHH